MIETAPESVTSILMRRNPELYPDAVQVLPADQQGIPVQEGNIPIGVQQIAVKVDQFMPVIEKITGLSRRDISTQVLKAATSGKGLSSMLEGLMGAKPAPEPKIAKYLKVFAVWIPIFFGLLGLIAICLFGLYRLMQYMVGGL